MNDRDLTYRRKDIVKKEILEKIFLQDPITHFAHARAQWKKRYFSDVEKITYHHEFLDVSILTKWFIFD